MNDPSASVRKLKPRLSSERRRLLLTLTDGNSRVVPILFMLQGTGVKRLDCMLQWLIDNDITGQIFLDWFNGYHSGSPLSAISYLMTRIEKDPPRKLLAGKDFF